VLRAAKKGIIKSVKAHPGAHLKVDQVIVEFEESAPVTVKA
jgi:pyruvate/2-oxoglutarate dehydrogenase complex dihydrolipoamide acyltransferase (E2) component